MQASPAARSQQFRLSRKGVGGHCRNDAGLAPFDPVIDGLRPASDGFCRTEGFFNLFSVHYGQEVALVPGDGPAHCRLSGAFDAQAVNGTGDCGEIWREGTDIEALSTKCVLSTRVGAGRCLTKTSFQIGGQDVGAFVAFVPFKSTLALRLRQLARGIGSDSGWDSTPC
ncbi:hypothetical protein IMCC21224_113035 [Puniceibacterium sp. IMCC21224]|nr:hypothetical protein IMCC21224_113035 [Puniceibacterium sp. IMCC21224]